MIVFTMFWNKLKQCNKGEYLTMGLFESSCYFSVIFSNKLLNFVLFHKCSFSLIVLKFRFDDLPK